MPLDSTERQSAFDPTNIVPGFVAVALSVLLTRLWFLQIVRGEELSRAAEKRTEIKTTIPAPRGMITDRFGRPLATVKPMLAAFAVPEEMLKQPSAISKLAKIIDEPADELTDLLKKNSFRKHLPMVVKAGITMEQAVAVEEQKLYLPGTSVSTVTVRSYPAKGSCAHVVGYVGNLSKEDLERYEANGLTPPTFVGKSGIERRYDLKLCGESGVERVTVDSRNRKTGLPERSNSVTGDKLILTIDLQLQRRAEQMLAGHKGAIVALKPTTGEVLCLASGPSFDPNIFTKKVSTADWNRIGLSPAKPMLNRATSGTFAPGSTMKMLSLIAAVKAGVVTPHTSFVCKGKMEVGGTVFRCLGTHGTVDYEKAIRESCNIYFANLALKMQRADFVTQLQDFGFGAPTGVDLLSEVKGIIPTDELVVQRKAKWFRGDNMNLAVGQGVLQVTPLQMAHYASVLANDGVGYRPTILLSRVPSTPGGGKPNQFVPEVGTRIDLPPEWWSRIRQSMVNVVETGTGHRAKIAGVRIAGKTGSADWDSRRRSHAWFIGYAPADNPQIAFAIVIEAVGRGGTEAAPLAGELVQTFLNTR
ncbi:MAG: penicillin-binding protein 2 [Fimbriimonadales bacterium]